MFVLITAKKMYLHSMSVRDCCCRWVAVICFTFKIYHGMLNTSIGEVLYANIFSTILVIECKITVQCPLGDAVYNNVLEKMAILMTR